MAYAFDLADLDTAAAVRRIAAEELTAALSEMDDPAIPEAKLVHGLRKHVKMIRGLIRLVRPNFPGYDLENATLRDAARGISGLRDAEVLRATLERIAAKAPPEAAGALDHLPGLHTDYDSRGQRLMLTVPPAWLPAQFIGSRNNYPRAQALTSFGALLNYDAYLNDTDDAGTYLGIFNEVRLFDTWGTLSNTGQYRTTFGGQASGSTLNNGYRRYDTTWRFSDDERLLRYMFPADDVDKTLAARPLKLTLPADGPVPRLIEELAKRPALAHFELERNGARIAVTRHAPARQAA